MDSQTELNFPQPGQLTPYGALPVPRLTPDLLALVHTGRVFSLGLPLFEGIPVPGPMVPFTLTPRMRHGDPLGISPASAAAETITLPIHAATHIDALCHIGEQQDAAGSPISGGEVRLYAGPGQTVAACEKVDHKGQHHLDGSALIPILLRGILLDVAGAKGLDVLPDSYEVTGADVRQALAWTGVQLTVGTAVFLRTGFYRHFRAGSPAYQHAIAGLGLEAAQLLVREGMILAGADNMTVEVMPPMGHPVHRYLIVHNGIPLVENLYLEQLAELRVFEFLLIMSPLRIQGATGSWVNPIAIA